MILKVNNIRLLMRIFIFQSIRNLECLISDNWNQLNFQCDRALLYLVSPNYQNWGNHTKSTAELQAEAGISAGE